MKVQHSYKSGKPDRYQLPILGGSWVGWLFRVLGFIAVDTITTWLVSGRFAINQLALFQPQNTVPIP